MTSNINNNNDNKHNTITKATILKRAQDSGLTLLHDRELAWVIGEWKAHDENTNENGNINNANYDSANRASLTATIINWNDILDLVCFDLQKRIVHQQWRQSFNRNWLQLLFPNRRRRKLFVRLMNEAQRYCLCKLRARAKHTNSLLSAALKKQQRENSTNGGAAQYGGGASNKANRWSGLSQAGFELLFPSWRRRAEEHSTVDDEPALKDEEGSSCTPNTNTKDRTEEYFLPEDGRSISGSSEDDDISMNDEPNVKRLRMSLASLDTAQKHELVELTIFLSGKECGDHVARVTKNTTSLNMEDRRDRGAKQILSSHARMPHGKAPKIVEHPCDQKRDASTTTPQESESTLKSSVKVDCGGNKKAVSNKRGSTNHISRTGDSSSSDEIIAAPDDDIDKSTVYSFQGTQSQSPTITETRKTTSTLLADKEGIGDFSKTLSKPLEGDSELASAPVFNPPALPNKKSKSSCHKNNTDDQLRWEPRKFNVLAPPPASLTQEHQELAFLLEQAPNPSTPWKHVEQNMTSALKRLMESKAHLVSFRQHGHKFRCLVGEKACARRIAFEGYRMELRNNVFEGPAATTSDESQQQQQQEANQAISEKPAAKEASISATQPLMPTAPTPLAPAGAVKNLEQPLSPRHNVSERALPLPRQTNPVPTAALLQPRAVERIAQKSGVVAQSPIVAGIMVAAVAATQVPTLALDLSPRREAIATPMQATEDTTTKNTAAKIESPVKEAVAAQPFANDAVPARVEMTDGFGGDQDGASDLTTNEAELNDTSLPSNTDGSELVSMQPARNYVSTLRSYQLFSSSMRREAHLLLHISQWQTWHVTDHSNGSVFVKNQETVMNEFRDDELYLSRQAFKKATVRIPYTNVALLDMAKLYTSLREKTWVWWCSLVQGCCVEFTTQFPRVWDDFEYTQRSLWEYFTQLEIGMREYHFQECLRDRSNATAADTSPLLEQQNVLPQRSAESGQYVHTYISSLNEYLNFSVSVASKAFLQGYLRVWKNWLESRDETSSRISFLEGEENMLEKFRRDEHARVEASFRVPYLQVFNSSYGRPLLVREIELYLTLREKLWYLFCREILWESWKDFITKEDPNGFDEFEQNQKQLWDYFEKMERALLKVHGSRCSQLSQAGTLLSPQQQQQQQQQLQTAHTNPIDAATLAMMGSPFAALLAAQAALSLPVQQATMPLPQTRSPALARTPLSAIAGSPFVILMGAQPSSTHIKR